MSLRLVKPPEIEPVTLTEAKAHLRLDTNADDGLIETLIVAARQYAEGRNGRVFIAQEWELTRACFNYIIDINVLPLIEIVSVGYIDQAGVAQTLDPAGFATNYDNYRARLFPGYQLGWPDTRRQDGAVTIRFKAGYGEAEDVPATIKQAILMLVAHWYENREPVVGMQMYSVPMSVDALLSIDRVIQC